MRARLLSDYFKRNAMQLQKADITKRDLSTGEILGKEPPPVVLLINQMREAMNQNGDPERIPGGRQLRHSCSIIMRAKKTNQKEITLDADGNIAVIDHTIKVRKNKVGPPLREVDYHVRADKHINFFGVDIVREAVELASTLGLLKSATDKSWSSGRVYLFGEEIPADFTLKVPTSRDKSKSKYCLEAFLYSNDEWYEKVMVAVIEAISASRYDDSITSVKTGESHVLQDVEIFPEVEESE